MGERLSEIVFLLIQQKKNLTERAANSGCANLLNKAEAAHNLLSASAERPTQSSISIRKGAVLTPVLVDFKGDVFTPFKNTSATSKSHALGTQLHVNECQRSSEASENRTESGG